MREISAYVGASADVRIIRREHRRSGQWIELIAVEQTLAKHFNPIVSVANEPNLTRK